jgi:hypothetical protein
MPLSATAYIDFGYPWWLSYGHLPILALAAPMLLLGYARKWSRWPILFLSVVALWSGTAFLVERFVIDVNGLPALPTQSFLRSGAECPPSSLLIDDTVCYRLPADPSHEHFGMVREMTEWGLRTYCSEPNRGRQRWQDQRQEQQAVYANRRRIRGLRVFRHRPPSSLRIASSDYPNPASGQPAATLSR